MSGIRITPPIDAAARRAALFCCSRETFFPDHLHCGGQYHHCCHSNLTRAFSDFAGIELSDAEHYIHDVLNVFMCTGFTRDTGLYFMKASPVRPGDYLEFFPKLIFSVRFQPALVVIVLLNIQVIPLAAIRC